MFFLDDLKKVFELGKDGLKIAYTALQGFAFFLTLAVAVILLVAYVVVRIKAKEKLQSFKTLALGVAVGYAVTIIACIGFFMITRLSVKAETDVNFYLMLGFLTLCLAYVITVVVTNFVNKKVCKICNFVGIGLLVAYIVVMLCLLPTVDVTYEPLSKAGMYTTTAILVIAVGITALFLGKDGGTATPTKNLAYAGICIALAYALSYVKLFSLPQGGSVTLVSMLPLIIYAYIFGARKGILVGVIYGALQCLQSPQIYQPLQVVIDYPIAFGVLGLAGIVKNLGFLKTPLLKFIFGACLACILRYFCHVISGIFVFSSWAMEGYTAVTWGFVYNLYLIAELALILVVGCGIFASKGLVKQFTSINPYPVKLETVQAEQSEQTTEQEVSNQPIVDQPAPEEQTDQTNGETLNNENDSDTSDVQNDKK